MEQVFFSGIKEVSENFDEFIEEKLQQSLFLAQLQRSSLNRTELIYSYFLMIFPKIVVVTCTIFELQSTFGPVF